MKNIMKILDLFCGAGGLSIGFERSGFQVINGFDNFEAALKTFNNSHSGYGRKYDLSNTPTMEELEKIGLKIDEVDGIVGGPPCQGFSDAKGKRTELDDRNDLVFRFIDWVVLLKPKFFVMENVVGIETLNDGKFINVVEREFTKEGYTIQRQILHSAQYGVPQKRERMIMIGFLKDLGIHGKYHPEPTHWVPEDMRGVSVSKGESGKPTPSLNDFFVTGRKPERKLKKYVTVETAFSGLPEIIRDESGHVQFNNNFDSEFMKWITYDNSIKSTENHIANKVMKKYLKIVNKIPEGKIFRSNRFGDRYIGAWDIFTDELSQNQLDILQFLGRNQTKKTINLEGKSEGHVPLALILEELHLESDKDLKFLANDAWISKKEVNGIVGYKLRTKAGLRPRFFRLDRKSISHTILTVDFDAREKIHPCQNRGLSLREGARLQSFPDNVIFQGSFKEIARQIGNAVPPRMAFHIAERIKKLLLKTTPDLQFH